MGARPQKGWIRVFWEPLGEVALSLSQPDTPLTHRPAFCLVCDPPSHTYSPCEAILHVLMAKKTFMSAQQMLEPSNLHVTQFLAFCYNITKWTKIFV